MWTFLLLLVILIVVVSALSSSEAIGSWNHLFADVQHDPEEFYQTLEKILTEREVPDFKTSRREFKEGGIFSYHRLYLEVSRGDYIFHICAAPWGTGFFFSWRLRQRISGLTKLPFVGRYFAQANQSDSYYKMDTDTMFRTSVHQCTMAAIDRVTEAKGIRGLTELERQPDLRSMFK